MMPVERDGRIPMSEIYQLFRGDGSTNDVLRAANSSALTDAERSMAQFYAHLYLGLFHEVSGNEPSAREHLTRAAEDFRMRHYMWDVARVHAERWKPPQSSEEASFSSAPASGSDAR
jgi:hypothetical protein